MSRSIEQRIKDLEEARDDQNASTCVLVTAYSDEPEEAAVARYRFEHPDTPEDARFIIFISGFGRPPT
jgi:hypothetical protein